MAEGQKATFSVLAGRTAPLSYQWLKNGGTISGATAASYTTPLATSAENGATFQVEIKNSVGSLKSAVCDACSYSASCVQDQYIV